MKEPPPKSRHAPTLGALGKRSAAIHFGLAITPLKNTPVNATRYPHAVTNTLPSENGLPRRCAPRNDEVRVFTAYSVIVFSEGSLERHSSSNTQFSLQRHCERSAAIHLGLAATQLKNTSVSATRYPHVVTNSLPGENGLPRRCAPRNDVVVEDVLDGTHKSLPRHNTKAAGFTLLEVLIALSIFAIMGLASYHLLSSEARTQQALETQSEHHNHWQRGMMRLTQDLQQAVNRSIREDYGTRKPALIGEGDSLTFTRQGWSNPLHQSRSELQRVDYRVTTAGGNAYLQRSFWFALDRAPASQPITQKLLPDVEQLQLRYYHSEHKIWLDQWPPVEELGIGLPQAIEVTLTSAEHGQVQRLIALTLNRRPQS